ncbi:MAG: tetratricopeptide repeat protein [Acidimicrobiales bacterium]
MTDPAGLGAQRDFLLGSLRDLDAERAAGDIEERDYEELRDGYTARAAAVLREMQAPVAADRVRPTGRRGRVIIAAAIAATGIAAGVLLARNAGTRLPGDNISGSTPASPVAQLDAQAQQQLQQSNLLGAIKTFDAALKIDPRDLQALAYKGWLLRLAGSQAHDTHLVDAGLASIRKAEAIDPNYPDAHFFAGETLLRDKGDPKGAIVEFESYLASNPPQAMIAEVRLELQSAQAAAAGH